MAQFFNNSSHHAITKMTLFYSNYGCNPVAIITATSTSPIPQAEQFIQQLISIQKGLMENLTKTNLIYKHHYDKKRCPAPLLELGSKFT